MKQSEKLQALKALAIQHPRAEDVGYLWKNPLNPRSLGRRWTQKDLDLFRKFQADARVGRI